MTWLLAHQGGWDELLIFGAPAVLAVLGLRWAERRARARSLQQEHEEEEPHLRREDGGL